MTTPAILQSSKRTVFAVVPEKGPISFQFGIGSPTSIYEALREFRSELDRLRPGRSSHPVVFGLTEEAFGNTDGSQLALLTKALGVCGFSVAGVLADSPNADAVSEKTDLLVMAGPEGGSFEALEFHRLLAEEAHQKAKEAAAWEEALAMNAEFNANEIAAVWDEAHEENRAFDIRREEERLERERLLAEEAAHWEQAIAENARFDLDRLLADWAEALVENELFDRRVEASAWDEAIAEDARFEARKEALRREEEQRLRAEEAQAWDEALAEDASRQKALLEAEAAAWDEAIAYNKRLDEANEVARKVREAVLNGEPAELPPISIEATHSNACDPVPACSAVGIAALPVTPVSAVDVTAQAVTDAEVATAVEAAEPQAEVAVEEEVEAVGVVRKTLVHNGRVRSGSQIYADGRDLMLFGSLSSGAEAVSDGNINVYGAVHGRLIAGASGDINAHVICQKFHGELVSIGGRYCSFENLSPDLRGAPVHFWVENDGIHYRRLDLAD